MTRLSLFVSGLLAFSLTACDDETSEPTFEPTSVPESKPIDELDEDEQQTFCEEATDWASEVVGDDLPTLLCNSEGITAAVGDDGSFDVAACKAARDTCLSEPSEIEFEDEDLQCSFEDVEACGATVGEFSSCFEETARLLDRAAKATTCERFAAGDYPDESDFLISAECEALFERCSGDEAESESEPTPAE
ncbi:MAG: hypothetical protein ACRBN8_34705 [Nannocystales bacterium]